MYFQFLLSKFLNDFDSFFRGFSRTLGFFFSYNVETCFVMELAPFTRNGKTFCQLNDRSPIHFAAESGNFWPFSLFFICTAFNWNSARVLTALQWNKYSRVIICRITSAISLSLPRCDCLFSSYLTNFFPFCWWNYENLLSCKLPFF